MNRKVLTAVFKRDFVSYFSNPTGYVFICVFVVLSALGAFWPPEFFSNNLADLDQLTKWMPFIMLVFIPAITMSIWAEERRQGTDELLLTIPASDVDVVLGKYFAGVAIFTVSLLFSMFSIFLVFSWGLGNPDGGLFLSTYIGYWFIGIAMLSIGMVASFLTDNLTVGFILGALFNLPLALFGVVDSVIKWPGLADAVGRWSALAQFRDFQRGVLSLSGVSYFVMLAAVMLYLSVVLIGRRHWRGGADGDSLLGHYAIRTFALLLVAAGVNLTASHLPGFHVDLTSEQLNSLSPQTEKLVQRLKNDENLQPIKIDAYVSPKVPAEYAQTKLNLLATLDELASLSGGTIQVQRHIIENFSDEATLAERTYGIESREVDTRRRGARTREEIFMGVAFTCGLDKVVIPFLDKGVPIEYELVRSIATVAQQERKQLGILKTDVQLFGTFSMQGPVQESRLVTELKKQYEVVEVDPANPIEKRYDVLLAIQPSSLGPAEFDHFMTAVKGGQPTAIFEDPFPLPNFYPTVPGTTEPKRPPGGMGMMGMMGGGGPPQPKGDISQLWRLLGVNFFGDEVIWQDYNPEPKAGSWVDAQWVFIDDGNGATSPFNDEHEISANMRQILLLFSGAFRRKEASPLAFAELAVTGDNTGTITTNELRFSSRMGGNLLRSRITTREQYIVAAHITGQLPPEELSLSDDAQDDGQDPADIAELEGQADGNDINVVLVSDIDWIAPIIFMIREIGQDEDMLVNWKFQNVAFALNVLDVLAGDNSFVDIRKRTRNRRVLAKIEEATETYRAKALTEQSQMIEKLKTDIAAVRDDYQKAIDAVDNRPDLDPRMRAAMKQQTEILKARERDVKIAKLEADQEKSRKQIERQLNQDVSGVQDLYKFFAIVLPPIPPILLALCVYFRRRAAEQEGVARARLRFGSEAVKQKAAGVGDKKVEHQEVS